MATKCSTLTRCHFKLAALNPWQRRGVNRLSENVAAHVDPLNSKHVLGRMASEHFFNGVELAIVKDTVATAIARRTGKYGDALADAHEALEQFMDEAAEAGLTTKPEFDSDEYDLMAQFVRGCAPAELTALSEREFFAGGQPVALATINAFIDSVLHEFIIWDRDSGTHFSINTKLINEVRGALARMLHVPERPGREMRTVVESPFAAVFALEPGAWTSSDEIWAAWVAYRGAAAGKRSAFFQELNGWAGERIKRTQPREHGRKPYYAGLSVKK
jgi:hypothetical protein